MCACMRTHICTHAHTHALSLSLSLSYTCKHKDVYWLNINLTSTACWHLRSLQCHSVWRKHTSKRTQYKRCTA
jgi:hypothetical protein